ncbi:MAG: histidine--tRNA ligase [Egibacteraceae bacterium]
MKLDNSPPRGTRDLLPDVVANRERVLAAIAEVYRRYGYERIETPCLEDITRLESGEGGENEKLIFRVLRRGLPDVIAAGAAVSDLVDLGLRFDLTVPLTRFYGDNQAGLRLPFRAFQVGSVWRAERPQRGRYRQFTQCDIDIIGEGSVLAESELIEATTEALSALGLAQTVVRLGDRRVLTVLASAIGLPEGSRPGFFVTLDKLDKIGWDGVRAELLTRELTAEQVDRALDLITGLKDSPPGQVADRLSQSLPEMPDDVLDDLATTAACLERLRDHRDVAWVFDPTLVRGMGYYTGQIFEVSHPGSSSSIAGGGRYDRLIGRCLGRDVPACGFSLGFERIVDLLEQAPKSGAVALLYDVDDPLPDVLAAARQLRAGGRTVCALSRRGQLGKQLARLEQWGFTSFVHLRKGEELSERPLGAVPPTRRQQT